MFKRNRKAFTILELLVVVAIVAILAAIAIPNFIGKIEQAKASRELAEISTVTKAVNTYYADNGFYPTLQAKDGALLQPQPIYGSPHNIDFSPLLPDYLVSLPHFSYWWVDYEGRVYHTQDTVGYVANSVFTPTDSYSYTLYKVDGSKQVLSAPYTLQTGEYVAGIDDKGIALPKLTGDFTVAKAHVESGHNIVTGITVNKATTSLIIGGTETLDASITPANADNKAVAWATSNSSVATVDSSGLVAGVLSGTATITATTVEGGYKATCVVTVATPVTGIVLNKTTATLAVNATETLLATISPTNATNNVFTWSTSNASVATVSSSGLVTGKASGTAIITVTTADGNKTDTCTVTVPVPVTPTTFTYTGNYQTYTVTVSGSYKLEVWGAQGGSARGGYGGYTSGTKSFTAGQIIYIYVGGAGNYGTGGWNGGGASTSSSATYGSGGGASDIRFAGTALGNRIIVAGGGGGGNSSTTHATGGGGGGSTGGGAGGGVYGGRGGTQSSGGLGGQWVNAIPSAYPEHHYSGGNLTFGQGNEKPGTLGIGGSNVGTFGSGGGGGYYGGGSGMVTGNGGAASKGTVFGGGGGSSYIGGVTSGTMQVGVRAGNGQAKITYVGP